MIKQLLLLGIVLGCMVQTLSAQFVPLDIPVTRNGMTLRNPWAGGLNLPQFSAVDLNNDGIDDLVVFDRAGRVLTTFINHGTPNQVDYDFAPTYMKYLPQMEGENFMLFRDYNCDGIDDIFGMYEVFGQGVGVAVWKGSYVQDTIRYTIVKEQLRYDASAQGHSGTSKLFVFNTDLPAIDDIDGDGDVDILGFTLDACFSTNVFYYKNMSAENGYSCDSLMFRLESQCWGLFSETGDSNRIVLGPSTDSCANNSWFNALPAIQAQYRRAHGGTYSGGRHVGANTTMVDFNGDNSMDLAIGSVTFKNVNMLSGDLINDTVLIHTQDYQYPVYNKPVDIYTFPSTFFLDVNNDGKTDFLAAPSEQGPGESVMDSVCWYYENIGSNSNMLFDFQQKDFLVGDMIDVGDRAYPALFDYDKDGDLDIIVGGMGRPNALNDYEYGLTLWENTGTLANPSYSLVTNDYANTNILQAAGLHPTMGDLDGDGDWDMICGAQDGTLWYFENTAPVGATATWASPIRNYASINVGQASSPQLVDLDRDTDLDLVIGSFSGGIHYYENTGTASTPVFASTTSIMNLGGYNVAQAYSRHSMPYFHDNAGQWELFIGHRNGNIIHLGNINNNVFGTYDTLSEHYNDIYYGTYAKPAGIVDINGDFKTEFMIGTGCGGMAFLTDQAGVIGVDEPVVPQSVAYLYPNPVADQLTIALEAPLEEAVQVTFYNALGQVLLQDQLNENRTILDVRSLPAGVIFVELRAKDYHETVQFIKE